MPDAVLPQKRQKSAGHVSRYRNVPTIGQVTEWVQEHRVPKRTKGPCVGYGCPDFHAAGNSEDGAKMWMMRFFWSVVVRGFEDMMFVCFWGILVIFDGGL